MRKVLQNLKTQEPETDGGCSVMPVPVSRRNVGKAACATAPHETYKRLLVPRFRQAQVEDSRSVAAEWGDGPLDADGDTKRLSRQEVGGANPLLRREVAQQESASQIAAPSFLALISH